MSAIINVFNLPLEGGNNVITATALSTGLDESIESNSKTFTEGGFVYALSDTADYYILTSIDGVTAQNIKIPATYNGIAVREIAEGVFEDKKDILSVTIPASITKISDEAFRNCKSLKTVTIADNSVLEIIGNNAFRQTNINSITIPPNVKSIGDYAFFMCNSLSSIKFGGPTTRHTIFVREKKNMGIPLIHHVYANGTYDIDDQEMRLLGTDGEYKIWKGFVPAEAARITIHSTVNTTTHWSTQEITDFKYGDCFTIDEKNQAVRTKCEIVESDLERNGLTIGTSAFSDTSLEYLHLPNRVTSIGDRAFENCEYLESVITGFGVKSIGDHAFAFTPDSDETSSLQAVCLGGYVAETEGIVPGQYFEKYPLRLASSNRLESIGDYAFQNSGDTGLLQSITIPASVTWLGVGFLVGTGVGKVTFDDVYGWFGKHYELDEDIWEPQYYLDMNFTGDSFGYLGEAGGYYYKKIDQMPAPTLELEGSTLTITDKTTIAEKFNIYINGDHVAVYDIQTGALETV